MTEQSAKQQLAGLFRKSETITASELAECVGRDGKVVRAYLRKIAARDQSTLKNQRWAIDRETAMGVAEHFENAKRTSSSE